MLERRIKNANLLYELFFNAQICMLIDLCIPLVLIGFSLFYLFIFIFKSFSKFTITRNKRRGRRFTRDPAFKIRCRPYFPDRGK